MKNSINVLAILNPLCFMRLFSRIITNCTSIEIFLSQFELYTDYNIEIVTLIDLDTTRQNPEHMTTSIRI